MDFDESRVRYYDDLNIAYGDEEEKQNIKKELEDELGDILSPEELETVIHDEIKYIIPNRDVRVKLLEDYQRWGTSDFVKGAEGIVREWKFFRFKSYNWYYAYVMVEINGESCPVNIEKLEVLDKNFIDAERKFFMKFKDTYEYKPEDNLLVLNDKLSIHCTALVNRILGYIEKY